MIRATARFAICSFVFAAGTQSGQGETGGYDQKRLRTRSVLRTVTSPEVSSVSPSAPSQYYGVVRVGTPPQEFRVVFDSCSGSLILPSTKCEDSACQANRLFASEKSSTSQQIGWADEPTKVVEGDERDIKSINFLGQDVTGEFVRDVVCVGREQEMCGASDFVALSEEPDEPFTALGFDGVLGLAPKNADGEEFSVVHALFNAAGHKSKHRVLAFHLGNDGGQLLVGGYSKDLLAAEPTWVPSTSNSSWQVAVEDITIDGKRLDACGASGCMAIIDTGASLVMAPGSMLLKMLNQAGLQNDCRLEPRPPSIGFVIGGKHMDLNAEDYLEGQSGDCRVLLGMSQVAAAPKIGESSVPTLVLGYPFLRRHHAILNLDTGYIGFASARRPVPANRLPKEDHIASVELIALRT